MKRRGAHLLGFDIGGTKCAVVLARAAVARPRILGRIAFATAQHAGPSDAIAALSLIAESLLNKHGLSAADIPAAGISCGGPLDSKRGLVLGPPNLPGWGRVPIARALGRRLKIAAFLQNDANACALAEWHWGAGRGCRNIVFLTFGTGMGAGLIIDGRLYSGTNDCAGEVGHLRLSDTGPVGYGKVGSFEGFCSGGGLSRADAQGRTAEAIFAAAAAGEAAALAVVRESARQLGRGVALLVDILNPERVVIGSIFARQRRVLWPLVREELRREALPHALRVCRVVPAHLGESIGDFASLAIAAEMQGR